ncbi:NAD-dependent epimerase/dehydratase family protein [Ensifer soli]|uniref:NAD-dependent epimerase/dehydratase family protein n=1 Tax=Ciceribacter sp. sgz301302 TaxID=3342379 RepID=UPI0035B91F19
MTRVLVTGGTGFVGRFIVEDLLANGYAVTVACRTPPASGLFSKPVAFLPMTLDADSDPIDLFSSAYYLVHAALDHLPGRYRGGEGDDPAGFHARNLDGTARLFEAAKDAGVRRCVFLSSRAVYGPQSGDDALAETMPCRPDTDYGRVKLQGERLLQALCGHGFVTASLRVTGVYGAARPGQPHKWQELFDTYRAGRDVPVRIGTEVHGRDVAAAVRLMLAADPMRVSGESFNVADVVADTREILAPVKEETGCPHPLPEAARRAGARPVDTAKLRALGWQPGGRSLFDATLRDLVRALRAAPAPA